MLIRELQSVTIDRPPAGPAWPRTSSASFILPFTFARDTFATRVQSVTSASWPLGRDPVWIEQDVPRGELLLYVAKYVNSPDRDAAFAMLWRMNANALRWLVGVDVRARWHLVTRVLDIPFEFMRIDLLLFRAGLGLLVIEARPMSADAASWIDFLHYFRFYRGQRGTRTDAFVAGPITHEVSTRFGLLSTCSGTGGAASRGPEDDWQTPGTDGGQTASIMIDQLISSVLATAATAGETANRAPRDWWQEIFAPGVMMSYAVLFVFGANPADLPAILYRVKHCFNTRQQLSPSAEQLDEMRKDLLNYADGQSFFATLQGAGFVAFDPPPVTFVQRSLPVRLRRMYQLLFHLVTFQRFALAAISDSILHGSDDSDSGSARARHRYQVVYRDFLEFMARGRFVHVSQSDQHRRYYEYLLRTYQVDALFADLRDEVGALKAYADGQERQRTERVQQRLTTALSIVTVLLIPTQVLLALFVDKIGQWPELRYLDARTSEYVTVAILAALLVLLFVLHRAYRR